ETRVRPYTIASAPRDAGPFEICLNLVPGGDGVHWLFDRSVDDELEFTGPFGTFTMAATPQTETVLLADETTIAPMRSMLRQVMPATGAARIHLMHVARNREYLLYRREFEEWSGRGGVSFSFEPLLVGGTAEARQQELSKRAEQ